MSDNDSVEKNNENKMNLSHSKSFDSNSSMNSEP